jgi:isopenicillin N synthase-like dioxygenase
MDRHGHADEAQVNVGLTLEAMTDGLCKANVHRVVFPTPVDGELPRDRKSIAYFSTPSHDIVMHAVKPGGITMKTQGEHSLCTRITCIIVLTDALSQAR